MIFVRIAVFMIFIISAYSKYQFPTKNKCLLANSDQKIRSSLVLPKCIQQWHDHDLFWTSPILHGNIRYDDHMKFDQVSKTSQCLRKDNSLVVNNGLSRAWWPHFPHVSELYFYFVSTLLWQKEVFQINDETNGNSTLCITSLAIYDDNAIWENELKSEKTSKNTNEYINSMFDSVERYFNLNTIQSKSCLQQSGVTVLQNPTADDDEQNTWPPNGWPPAWFLHPSDAYMLGNMILNITDEKEICKYAYSGGNTGLVDQLNNDNILIINHENNKETPSSDSGGEGGAVSLLLLPTMSSHQVGVPVVPTRTLKGKPNSVIKQETKVTGLNILLVNRKHNRETMNIDEVQAFLLAYSFINQSISNNQLVHSYIEFTSPRMNENSSVNRIFLTYFDDFKLVQQVLIMRHTDIFITAHGAAETNIAFMKPCSIVIEVFPWAYHPVEYFLSLANAVDVIHTEWQESYNHTLFFHQTLPITEQSNEIKACGVIMDQLVITSNYDTQLAEYVTNSENEIVNEQCYKNADIRCRACVQKADLRGLTFSLNKLNITLNSALFAKRNVCLTTHPFYNIHKINIAYPFSNRVTLHDGMLIGIQGSKSIYLLENGQARPFGSGRVFMAMGFDFGDVILIPAALMNKIPVGQSL